MRNVRDRQDRPRRLCADAEFAREFGVPDTSAVKAAKQVLDLSPQIPGKRPTGNRLAVKAAGINGPAVDGD
jgi:hypothetical protein